MNEIGEALAEIGQGTMAARGLEPRAGEASDGHTHESACLNCGTQLIGSHCHACGQSAHVHRTLGAFFHDLLHGAFHFEGKIWRTLPLLARHPGRLTREYIDGRRASYVSPIALFLFCVFLMFATFHLTQDESEHAGPINVTDVNASIAAQQAVVTKLQQQRTGLKQAGKSTDPIDDKLDKARNTLGTLRDLKANGVGDFDKDTIDSGIPAVDKAVTKFRANPDLAAYKAQTFAYKYSWALIPISVPFLWLLFPFSRRFKLYDHTVFVTYSLCFMAMLATAAMLLGYAGLSVVAALLFLVPPVHMYRQLKEAYGLGRGGALVRSVLLVGFAGTALLLFFMVVMAQTGS